MYASPRVPPYMGMVVSCWAVGGGAAMAAGAGAGAGDGTAGLLMGGWWADPLVRPQKGLPETR